MKKCINVRMRTATGWRDLPCELNGDKYLPVLDADGMIDRQAIFDENVYGSLSALDDHTVVDVGPGSVFEVTWQSDNWP